MTSLIFNTASILRPIVSFPQKLTILVGFVIFADWLFYGQPIGISLAVFIAALAVAVIVCDPRRSSLRSHITPVLILLFALSPLIENFGLLSALFGVMGIAYFTNSIATDFTCRLSQRLIASLMLLVSGPVRCFKDSTRAAKAFLHQERQTSYVDKLTIWIVPVVLVCIFTMLFASANPLIGDWFSYIDLWAIVRLLSFTRLAFWLFIFLAIWPFIFICIPLQFYEKIAGSTDQSNDIPRGCNLLGPASILRTVLLCNVLSQSKPQRTSSISGLEWPCRMG